ncbi:hypothetical protein CCP3SC1AL1_70004 [Gammaproteobacteria bacterium]
MSDPQDKALSDQDSLSVRRKLLQLSSVLPLSFLATTLGLTAGLSLLPEEACARGRRHRHRHHRHHKRRYSSYGYGGSYTEEESQQYSRYDVERSVLLRNIHTDETVHTVYWAEGRYVPDGLRELNYLMRDHYTGEVVRIDPHLFDLVYLLGYRLEYGKPIHVLSGYRSPSTNAMLREQSGAVASHSLHMDGMAIDLRAPGKSTGYLRKAAVGMQYGGVGYYPNSDFIHMDTGPVRYW